MRITNVLECHTLDVISLQITSDDKFIISGSLDKNVIIWNVEERRPVIIYKGHTGYVNLLEITSDSKYLISGSIDTTIKIWNIGEFVLDENNISNSNEVIIAGSQSPLFDTIFNQKLIKLKLPNSSMTEIIIYPMKINILHIYSFYEMPKHLKKALGLKTPITRDFFKKSPLTYAIEKKSHICIEVILNYMVNLEDKKIFAHSLHAIRDDFINLFYCKTEYLVPLIEKIMIKSENDSINIHAKPIKSLPINKLSPYFEINSSDFVVENIKQNFEKEVKVQYWTSYLSWNFLSGTTSSKEFLRAIYDCSNYEIYQTSFIQELIKMK